MSRENRTAHRIPYISQHALLFTECHTVHRMPYCSQNALLFTECPTVHSMPYCSQNALMFTECPTVHRMPYCSLYAALFTVANVTTMTFIRLFICQLVTVAICLVAAVTNSSLSAGISVCSDLVSWTDIQLLDSSLPTSFDHFLVTSLSC